MYVDDIVTGCSSLTQALALKQELIQIFNVGGFSLHKWSSNHPLLIAQENASLSFEGNDITVKILGLQWSPQADHFFYKIRPLHTACSKRIILSDLARIFDPLGFITPLTLLIKIILQHCWCLGLDWDAIPPMEVMEKWQTIQLQLPCLSDLSLKRHVWYSGETKIYLLGFCDASQKGYGAVIYLLSFINETVQVSLLCAKSKIAPLKRISLPRLELCAAELLAKLFRVVLNALPCDIPITNIFAWSDSSVTLAWIHSPAYRWKTFVAARVTKIQEIIPATRWYHVPTKMNPADCASRGVLPQDLSHHLLWWTGPPFVHLDEIEWPCTTGMDVINNSQNNDIQVEEHIMVLHTQVDSSLLNYFLDRFSSLRLMTRVLAHVIRFVTALQHPHQTKVIHALTKLEMHFALMKLVGWVQQKEFVQEIRAIKTNQALSKTFRKLNPFLDNDGILRVGGRLIHANLPFEQKHSALLPSSHRLTHRIIDQYHLEYLHPGVQALHSLLLQHFWIFGAKRIIRNRISKCLKCFKINPRPMQPLMGNLPSIRVSQIKAFDSVGVDFGGPFFITLGKSRGVKSQKAYVSLFVCLATKAIHLELVSDLTSDAFLAALRRFIARRGRCSQIFSDNGTNFVGAYRQLQQLTKNAVEKEGILWLFNPPSAPHFGGIWEAGIKSVKTHLKRVIGNQILTYEELLTVLTQIEALLNSRPLCALSSDPNDLQVLTPGHFLTLTPLSHIPESDLRGTPLNRLSRWQLLQRLHQDFWVSWHREYLHTLQQRSKWFNTQEPQITIDTLVLIHTDNIPPMNWPLGRIIALHPGSDGTVRVVTVKTATNTLKRPLVKLCPLPIN